MTTGDISRRLDDRAKRYERVVLQQGRLLTDDDFNASDELALERARSANVAIVGASGSPDAGFAPDLPKITGDGIDFVLRAGHTFVGGHLLSLPREVRYASQPDWLRQPADARTAPTGRRRDFVFLDVREQGVAAVEDEELREVALGGPDTTSRVRLMWRARLRQNVGDADCHDAWEELGAELRREGWELNPVTGELIPSARLLVEFDATGTGDDLCDPAVAGGYLGAENQTIRVMLTGPDRMTWAFDNAEPIYRAVAVERESDGRWALELETQPPDEQRWPVAGEFAEVLPVVARLDNGEPIKAARGAFSRVATSWDPSTSRLLVEPSVELDAVLEPGKPLFFRIWRRDELGTIQGEIPFTPGTPVPLGATGAMVTISGDHRAAGVYWTFSLRPETRDVVVPWSFLREPQAPSGPRRFIAPLGLISWHEDGGHVAEDCRRRYRRLTDEDGCCTVTVGDGVRSRGEFASIAAAVAALPRTGGTVCLLRGKHVGAIELRAKTNVRFVGCGAHSVWTAPEGKSALTLQECEHIRLEHLHMVGAAAPIVAGVAKKGSKKGGSNVDHFLVRDVEIRCKGSACIFLPLARDVEVTHSRLLAAGAPHDTPRPSIFLGGRRLVLEHCRVVWDHDPGREDPWEGRPPGGVQIAGGSADVRIEQCHVDGGFGAGITLGSRRFVPKPRMKLEEAIPKKGIIATERIREIAADYATVAAELPLYAYVPPVVLSRDEEGCLDIDPDPQPSDDPDNPLVPVVEGPVVRVVIRHNRLSQMGGPGVYGMWGASPYDMTQVIELELDGNEIERCARLHLRAKKPSLTQPSGGVILGIVDDAVITANIIRHNGRPSGRPCFGVFAAVARSVRMTHNRIDDNGRASVDRPPKHLVPGGIVVLRVQPITSRAEMRADAAPAHQARMALVVRDNEIIAPEGYALMVREAIGGVDVAQNRLVSLHNVSADVSSNDQRAFDANGAVVTVGGRYGSNRVAAEFGDAKAIYRKAIQPNPLVDTRLSLVDNDILFEAEEGRVRSVAALMGVGTVRMSGNEVHVSEAVDVFATGLAVGGGVRFAHNLFVEPSPWRDGRFSGFTQAHVNHTVDNQGIRCFAVGPGQRLAIRDNLMPSACDERKHGEGILEAWRKFVGPSAPTASWWLDASALRDRLSESSTIDQRLLVQALWSAATAEEGDDDRLAMAVAAAAERSERQELLATFDELASGFANVGEEEIAIAGRVVRDHAHATVVIADEGGQTLGKTEVGVDGRWRLRLPAGSEPTKLRVRVTTATDTLHDVVLDGLGGGDRRFVELLGRRWRPRG